MDTFFSSPIGRVAFLCRHILAMIPCLICQWILASPLQNKNLAPLVVLALVGVSVILAVASIVYFIGFAIFPRLVSIGLSKWFTLVMLVPVANFLFYLFLLFCPAGWLIQRETAS